MTSSKTEPEGAERRQAGRRTLLDTFSLAVVLPEKGPVRLYAYDLSELGVAFDVRVGHAQLELAEGEATPLRLYLNQTLYLPLHIRVVRVSKTDGGLHKVGAEIVRDQSEGYDALLAFLKMLDAIPASVDLDRE